MDKILIACPVSEHKKYILFKWLKMLDELTYKNFDILLVDNSKGIKLYMQLKALGYNVIYYKRKNGEKLRNIMLESMKIIREYFLANDYEYFFSLECDIFPPLNIIEHFLATRKQVIGASYFIGEYSDTRVLSGTLEYNQTHSKVKLLTCTEAFLNHDGTIKKAFQIGTGCLFIHKSIIQQIPFRIDEHDNENGYADSYFHTDLLRANIPVYLDTSIICKHYNHAWNKLKKTENL